MAFDWYGALRTEAESADFDLDEFCSKVEQVWVEGSITDEQRKELKDYASERSAEAGMSLADLAAAVADLSEVVSDLTEQVAALAGGSTEGGE